MSTASSDHDSLALTSGQDRALTSLLTDALHRADRLKLDLVAVRIAAAIDQLESHRENAASR